MVSFLSLNMNGTSSQWFLEHKLLVGGCTRHTAEGAPSISGSCVAARHEEEVRGKDGRPLDRPCPCNKAPSRATHHVVSLMLSDHHVCTSEMLWRRLCPRDEPAVLRVGAVTHKELPPSLTAHAPSRFLLCFMQELQLVLVPSA